MADGRVIGGHFLNSPVRTIIGSGIIVQSGLKWRKLNEEQVAEWTELSSESNRGVVSSVGRAVSKAVLPIHLRNAGSAAVGATVDATLKPSHKVRVDWADGKQSLIKMPDSLFTHFAMMLEGRRAAASVEVTAPAEASPSYQEPPTMAEQAFTFATGLIKDRLPAAPAKADIAEQLKTLTALRDEGIVTDEEFAAKKAELLARL